MWEWLWLPIDATRPHGVDGAIAWHGRLMVLVWAVLVPLAIGLARFAKVLPSQRWPDELDNQLWWRCHWILHSCAFALAALAFYLVGYSGAWSGAGWHVWLGRAVLMGMAIQVLSGVLRGTKGGPTDPRRDGSLIGDHYSMTPRRRAFEWCHKALGYTLLGVSAIAVLTGLWRANAPHWMWLGVLSWWTVLGAAFLSLQRRGLAVDTYQAIWGPDPEHPGNRLAPGGWGARRLSDTARNGGSHRA
ncbi:MAG: cytochrome b561 domain-containing protein [Pseudomonadota bacterium]